jgi:hypothetical protein
MVERTQARYEAAKHELEGLRAELQHIQSNEHKSRSLVEARPILEIIIKSYLFYSSFSNPLRLSTTSFVYHILVT